MSYAYFKMIVGLLAFGIFCLSIVVIFEAGYIHQLNMYEEFNRQYLAAQILEAELQHRLNDTNITLKIYEPPTGGMPL